MNSKMLARSIHGLAGIARFASLLLLLAMAVNTNKASAEEDSSLKLTAPQTQNNRPQIENSRTGTLEISLVNEDGETVGQKKHEVEVDGNKITLGPNGFLRLEVTPGTHVLKVSEFVDEIKIEVDAYRTAVAVLRFKQSRLVAEVENAKLESRPTALRSDSKPVKRTIRVKSAEGAPIQSARVFLDEPDSVSGKDIVETDSKGEVRVLNSEFSGFTVAHKQYETASYQAGNAVGQPSPEISIVLKEATSELEEVRVLAPVIRGGVSALVEVRRKNRGVAEVLGAEQMARAGDSDAGSSLRRVTGLTLVAGKYVYIRGLGERYSSVLLNDSTLSSPEPARRVVPLDLFPTSVLESVVIEKSYSSELPGEFGGGAIRIGTKPIPDRFSAKISLGLGFASESKSLGYEGGRLDVLGIDDGTRKLPAVIADRTADGRRLKESNPLFPSGFSTAELQEMGRSFQNTWSAKDTNVSSVPSLSLSIGDRFQVSPNLTIGGQVGALYGSDADYLEKKSTRYSIGSGGGLVSDSDTLSAEASREVRLAGTSDFGASLRTPFGEQKISTSILLLRNSEDSVTSAAESNANGRYRTTELNWVERELFIRQLRGEHSLKIAGFKWRYSSSDAGRVAPDSRSTRYILEGDQYVFSTRADGNQRSFSALNDKTTEWGLELKSGFDLTGVGRWDLTIGLLQTERNRVSGLRRFHFRDVRSPGSTLDLTKPVEEILKTENISPNSFQILETTRETDNYRAGQTIRGQSATVDWLPVSNVRISYGVRREISEQDVLTYNLFDPENKPVRAGLYSEDLLPAVGASWEFASNGSGRQQVRATYSETVSRPDFKELSTAPYTDEETGQEVIGNNRLRGAVLKNADLRYEWYLNTEESLSVAAFRKDFAHPIEQIIRPGSDGTIRSFDNANSALNTGIEFETRVKLRRLSDSMRRLTFATNVALIDSSVELSASNQGVQTSNSRPLQGQSPWVLNLQLFYDRPSSKVNAGLLFNMIGPRIREAASGGLPDVYEQPIEQLDAVGSWSMSGQPFTWQIRLKNLLDPETRLTQGDQTALVYRRGRAVSISMSAVF